MPSSRPHLLSKLTSKFGFSKSVSRPYSPHVFPKLSKHVAWLFVALVFPPGIASLHSQESGQSTNFPEAVRSTTIRSSYDQSEQPALFFMPASAQSGNQAVPLLVGLHSWSGDYRQKASVPMAEWCVAKGWAFVHPDFRGPNWTPQACGSDAAVQDVLDAVDFIKSQGRIDPSRCYLMGTSGGGHMSLLVAGRHPEIWAGVSAWVPICDLSAWFYECRIAGRRYADDLLKAIGAPPHVAPQQYARRSPIIWLQRAKNLPIDINAGINDGHTGSVPVSHALVAFNQLVPKANQITEQEILEFTGHRRVPESLKRSDLSDPLYKEKQPLFRRTAGKARITLFDGGHEGIPLAGLNWLDQQQRKR